MKRQRDLRGNYEFSRSYHSLIVPKQNISDAIFQVMQQRNLSLEELTENIDGMNVEQVNQVTAGEDYSMEALLKVLDAVDLEIEIKPRK
ncbi:hypothetical protein [Aquibacillus kalidii]|uniref:hypothetical protein n=1 Tax=Aquibacillus kalidii TaxID=2762597 RepID=UPI001648BFBF|nr:hypothetical protein [Aquibacillus kalidii]